MLDYFSFVVFSKTLTSSIPSGAIYEPCRHILGQFCPPPPPSKTLLWNSCYWILWLVHGPTRELFEMGFSSPGKYERQVESYHIILKKILYQVQVALLFVECSNYFFIYSVINLETTLYKVHSGFSYIEKP